MEVNKKIYDIPRVLCEALVKINATSFHKICREMHALSEHIELQVSQKNIKYSCVGDVIDRSSTYTTGDEVCNLQIKLSDPEKVPVVQGIFELRNIVTFTKCGSLCDYIQIYLKNDKPLCIKYTIATLGQIKILLSPVTNDDDELDDEDNDAYEDDEVVYKTS
jgi:hypothetical protein